jgi:cell division protein FtsL
MNAAARLVHQSVLSRHLIRTLFFSRQQITVAMLALAVLLSALGIIYVTHVTRILHAAYQRNLSEQDRLHVEHGQFLLERSTWMMQARVQQIAQYKLGMIIPDSKSVVVIHE